MEKMTMTSHNKKGVKSTHHQDRTNTEKATHIDKEKSKENVYWQWNVGRTEQPNFEACELEFYEERYGKSVEEQNKRNEKNRHTERNKTVKQLYNSNRTAPTETYFQLGNRDSHADGNTLLRIMSKFQRKMNKYNKNFHILDIALHVDEATPHIAYRSVIDYDKDGIITIGQDKGLEAMGFDLDNPNEPKSRTNNRRMTFDKFCRNLLIEICKEYHIEIEYVGDGHKHYEKEEFIKKQELEKEYQQKINEYDAHAKLKYDDTCKTIDRNEKQAEFDYYEKKKTDFEEYKKMQDMEYKNKLELIGLGADFGMKEDFVRS